MIYEISESLDHIKPIESFTIKNLFDKNEKALEVMLTKMIGDSIFPELLVVGNERSMQKEPDIFAINKDGDLIVFELKVDGQFDRSKVLQAMDYAQRFSHWGYKELNEHYMKHPSHEGTLIEKYIQAYGCEIDLTNFNRKQKIVIISNYSEIEIAESIKYWRKQGVDIEEYYYRFYKIGEKSLIELSNERAPFNSAGYNCWINTCSRHFGNATMIDMIRGEKAAAYGDRAHLIDKWLNRAHVFIYQNGFGIIGAGIGTLKFENILEGNGVEPGRAIHLNNFIHGVDLSTNEISKFISPGELKAMCLRDFYFANTIVPLSNDEAVMLYKICQERFCSQ